MTRFSADWHARRELSVLESERKLANKECSVGDIAILSHVDGKHGRTEFVATGMGTARMDLGATKSRGAESPASRKHGEAATSRLSDRSASPAPVYPLVSLCLAHGLTAPIPEYRFHAVRKWRFDYAWPLTRIAVEIEGGIWTQGRHTRGAGAIEDMRKYSAAALLGWRILYYQPSELLLAIADLRIEFAR